MNVVDSSAWLEYLTGSERAELLAEPIEKTGSLIVPVVVIYELFKKVYRERGEEDAALEVYGLLAQKAQSWISIHPWRWLLRASGFLWPTA
jgi:toxin FitB